MPDMLSYLKAHPSWVVDDDRCDNEVQFVVEAGKLRASIKHGYSNLGYGFEIAVRESTESTLIGTYSSAGCIMDSVCAVLQPDDGSGCTLIDDPLLRFTFSQRGFNPIVLELLRNQ